MSEAFEIPHTQESVEIGVHKYGVVEIDGKKYVQGCFIDGKQMPDPADLPAGYAVLVNAAASLEISAEQLRPE